MVMAAPIITLPPVTALLAFAPLFAVLFYRA
jgi:hypothetical protein